MKSLLTMALVAMAMAAHAQQIPVDTFPMASVVSPDNKYLLVMTAGSHPPGISVIDLASARELSRTLVADAWLGLVMTKAGDKVYVGGGSRAAVFEFTFAGGVLTAGRTFPVVAEKDRTPQDFVGDVRLSPDGRLLYAANVHRDTVVSMNPQSGLVISRIKTGRRPYRILFHPAGKTFYVSSWADGAIGQYDVNSGDRLANFRVAPHPTDMVWADERVFVAGANTNNVYVMGASESGDLTKIETINLAFTARQPLGTTPSALALSADKKLLYVACSDANAVAVIDVATGERSLVKGFVPTGLYPTAVTTLADGRLVVLNGHGGSVQLVGAPDDEKLIAYTNEVLAKSPYSDDKLDAVAPDGSPVRAGGPIKHVVYVVASNKAEGVNWATAAISPDYTERLSQNSEAGRRRVYDYEGQDPANSPPAGYLWNAAAQAGIKIRNYGFQVHNREKATAEGEQVDRVYDSALAASTDMEYRGPDPAYPDAERAKEFADEVKDYGELGDMPQLLLLRIGDDAQALRTVVDAVLKSRFWNETAIFVVDARSNAQVISPWGNRDDAAVYGRMPMLRTVEVILGLRPMTTFDAAATPLYGAFTNRTLPAVR